MPGCPTPSALDAGRSLSADLKSKVGMKATATLLHGRTLPTAIMCSNDMTAMGVLRQSYDEKISVPRDLSVVGFDDIRFAQFILPPLTTVQMSQAELGRLAFHALLTDVERQTPAPHGTEYTLQTGLVLRESTAMAPGSVTRSQRNGDR